MNAPAEAARIRRVILALEHSGVPPTTIELALRLARQRDAELAALLIENSNLLRAAAFPAAREILRHTGTERALNTAVLVQQLQRTARRLQSELERKAGAGGVRTSFRTLRGPGIHAALDSGLANDLLLFSRPASARPPAPTSPVAIVDLGGSSAQRVEAVAKDLLEGFAPRPTPPLVRINGATSAAIASACAVLQPNLLVMPASALPSVQLRALLDRIACPVLLVN